MTITLDAHKERRAAREAALDRQRAEYYGRVDYWNDPRWRRERVIDVLNVEEERWQEEHRMAVAEKFFALLRERLPEFFTKRTISVSDIRRREQTIKEVFLAVGCSPRLIRSLTWPVGISQKAERCLDVWAVQINQEYRGQEYLLPEARSFEEIYREMYGDEGGATK